MRIGIRRGAAWWGLGLVMAVAACTAAHQPDFGSATVGKIAGESSADRVWRLVARAESLRRRAQEVESQALVDQLLAEDPLFVPALRLRQDQQRANGRIGLAWSEVDELKSRHPDRPEPLYLELRLVHDLREQCEMVAKALQRFPDSFWLRYAAAWCLSLEENDRQRQQASRILEHLVEAGPPWSQTVILAHNVPRGRILPSPLLPRMRQLAQRIPEDGRLDLLLYIAGSSQSANLLAAADKEPEASEWTDVLGETLTQAPGHARALLRFLAARPATAGAMARGPGGLALARLARLEGEPELALDWLARACGGRGPEPATTRGGRMRTALRELTAALARKGDLEGAIAAWESRLPPALFDEGANRLAPRLAALRHGPARGVRGTPADAATARAVLDVLLRAGWVEEAFELSRLWRRQLGASSELAAVESEAEQYLRFEEEAADALVGDLVVGVGRPVQFQTSLDEVLRRLRDVSLRVLGRDVVGRPRILTFPILGGELIDPFGPGLPEFLDRYNRHLVLGRLGGHAPSVMLGTKIHEERLPPDLGQPLLGLSREVVIECKTWQATSGLGIGDPSGVALWNHYVLDLRAMREWVSDLLSMRERIEVQGLDAVLGDPIVSTPPLSFRRPCQINWKLAGRALIEGGWDEARTWREVYTLLRLHERWHLVDAHRYLPVMANLGPALLFFAAAGFSPKQAEASLEARAELNALASGADPWLTLAHLTGFVVDSDGRQSSVHEIGFRDLLGRLVRRWRADGAPGAVDPEHNLLAQLHLLSTDLIRRYAAELAAR